MKRILSFMLFLSGLGSAVAQNPQISGDLMLCPWTNGSANVANPIYETYQWYYKYWFTTDEFVAIQGADQPSFTYDWYTYDQSLFKVVVTLGNQTLESNVIQIDSHAWVGMTISDQLNETVSYNWNNGNYILCQGGSFSVSVNIPYTTNIQWYRDDLPIDGANQATYQITGPGNYYVVAAPNMCPNNTSSNQGLPIVVETDPNCNLGIENPVSIENAIQIYPNPVIDILKLNIDNIVISDFNIIDVSGKVLNRGKITPTQNTAQINVSHLSSGFYIITVSGPDGSATKKFIKS